MKASGKTTSAAPWPAASAASRPSLSIVASRSRMTGSACMQATFIRASMPGFCRLGDADGKGAVRVAGLAGYEEEPAALPWAELEESLSASVRPVTLRTHPRAGYPHHRPRNTAVARVENGHRQTRQAVSDWIAVDRDP